MSFDLRPYQRTAIDCLYAYMRTHDDNPAIVIPTGGGKTVVMAELIRDALTQWPGTRIAIVAHVKELVEQNADKLRRYWPEARIGIYAASLKRRDRFEPVIFASIQSVYDKSAQLGRFDLILVDEAHRIPVRGEGMYRRFIGDCRRVNPDLRVIGLTATPYRLGTGPVTGPEYVLNAIAYEAGVGDLIKQGYLCNLISKGGTARADLSNVHVRGGEYVAYELEAAVNRSDLVAAAVDEILAYCAQRRAWIVFCASVAHASAVSHALAARGVEAPVIEGNTPLQERDAAIARFQRGELRALCNVNVLSEGFDAPHVDAVILLRPTKSAGLYYQQVGRGLRLHPSKSDCLVLDFAGNILEHGPIDAIRVERPRKRGAKAKVVTAPTKQCPKCAEIILASLIRCPDCEHEFPRTLAKHDSTASNAPILSDEDRARLISVHRVTAATYQRHDKPGGTPSLLVRYQCGLWSFREWVCLEHAGIARARAVEWWRTRMPADLAADDPTHYLVPRTIDSALQVARHLKIPTHIHVYAGGKYPEVIAHEFADAASESEREVTNDPDANGSAEDRGGSAGQPQLPGMRQLAGIGPVRSLEDGSAARGAARGL